MNEKTENNIGQRIRIGLWLQKSTNDRIDHLIALLKKTVEIIEYHLRPEEPKDGEFEVVIADQYIHLPSTPTIFISQIECQLEKLQYVLLGPYNEHDIISSIIKLGNANKDSALTSHPLFNDYASKYNFNKSSGLFLKELIEQIDDDLVIVDQSLRIIYTSSKSDPIKDFIDLFKQNRDTNQFRTQTLHLLAGRYIEIETQQKMWDQEELTVFILKDVTKSKHLESRLKESVSLVRSADDAKSRFIYNISHDLRTPLNGVMGVLELLKKTDLSYEQHQYIKIIKHSSDNLLLLLNDIIDLSRIEMGKLTLIRNRFNLVNIVESIIDAVSFDCKQKGIALSYHIDDEIPSVLIGDPTKLRQILLNLAGNATKFTEKGGIHCSCKMTRKSDTHATILFSVTDTGIGIPSDKVSGIFERFSQVDNSSTKKFQGAGLGLAITKEFVDLMNGSIKVSSEEGAGTTFKIEISFQYQQTEDTRFIEAQKKLKMKSAAIFSQAIHLYEYDAKMLTNFGLETKSSSSFKKSFMNSDIVFIDMSFFHNHREEITQYITNSENAKNTSFILIYSLNENISISRNEQKLFSSFFTPPLSREDIYSLIEKLEEKSKPSNEQILENSTILLIEDNLINRMITEKLLSKMGATVVCAENGKKALEVIDREKKIDLIITDIQMPEMDGFEFTRILREKDSIHSQVPVLALTAHAIEGYKEKCIDGGMDDFLTKPINIKDVTRKLRKLQKKRIATGAPMEQMQYSITKMLKAMANDYSLIGSFLEIFNKNLPHRVIDIAGAIENQDNESLYMHVHKLNGSLLNFHDEVLSTLASDLEAMTKEKEFDKVTIQFSQLKERIDYVVGELKDILNKQGDL